jgi:hypothetical protein
VPKTCFLVSVILVVLDTALIALSCPSAHLTNSSCARGWRRYVDERSTALRRIQSLEAARDTYRTIVGVKLEGDEEYQSILLQLDEAYSVAYQNENLLRNAIEIVGLVNANPNVSSDRRANCYNLLGLAYDAVGRYSMAEYYLRTELAKYQQSITVEDPTCAMFHGNLEPVIDLYPGDSSSWGPAGEGPRHPTGSRQTHGGKTRVRVAATSLGGGAHVRLAGALSATCPRL